MRPYQIFIALFLFSIRVNATENTCLYLLLDKVLSQVAHEFNPSLNAPRTKFELGEFVKVIGPKGSDGDTLLSYRSVIRTDSGFIDAYKISYPRDYYGGVPAIARVISMNDKEAILEMKLMRSRDHAFLKIPLEELESLPIGLQSVFNKKIKSLLQLELPFKKNEIVRFRETSGEMKTGRVLNISGSEIEIRMESGKIQTVSKNDVFKNSHTLTRAAPLTPKYRDKLVPEKAGYFPGEGFDVPKGAYRDLLNAAAKVSSVMIARGRSEEEIVRSMVDLVNTTIKSNTYGWGATDFGATAIEEIICLGGVCRHKSRVIASILSELGLQPRIMHADESLIEELIGQHGGHEWVEVKLKRSADTAVPFVVDAMHPEKLFPLLKSEEQVIKGSDPSRVKIHAVYRSSRKIEMYK